MLLAATQFLTRLPVRPRRHDPEWLPRGAKYFPLVGLAVGCIGAAILLLAARLWPAPLPQMLALGATILATGAFHEDGLADCADGLGGRSRERRLEIMKDPRLGAFGALALLLCLGLQAASLAALPVAVAAAALVGAHAAGRLAAVLVMAAFPYAGEIAASRIEHRPDGPSRGEVALALLFGLAPLLLLAPERAALGALLGAAAAFLAARTLCRGLGGYTGDVLGATVVICQTALLLGVAADPGRLTA
nr:adenosylcobinamide-GDP ribazoletransferase [Enterovirga sp. DB1703]